MFCSAKGYSKVRIFVEHESGAKVTQPQLDAMMREFRAGKVDGWSCTSWTDLGTH